MAYDFEFSAGTVGNEINSAGGFRYRYRVVTWVACPGEVFIKDTDDAAAGDSVEIACNDRWDRAVPQMADDRVDLQQSIG